jgi:hypothetical protein
MVRSAAARQENCYFWCLMRWNAARPNPKAVGAAAVIGILMVAWWWPGLTGQDRQTDVVIVSSSTFVESREFIDRRLREEGFTTAWSPSKGDACSFEVPDSNSFEVLVFELNNSVACDADLLEDSLKDLRSAWSSQPLIAVMDWDAPDPSDSLVRTLHILDVTLVDPRPLIGSVGDVQNCFWWDDCPPDGRITTILNGRLTEAGMQRLARSIVTGVLQ